MKKALFGLIVAAYGLCLQSVNAQENYCCPSYSCCDMEGLSGLYIGGNLGVITHVPYRKDLDGFIDGSFTEWVALDTDVTLGVQLGYDWQCCNSLLGLVVDWNWTNNDRKLEVEGDPEGVHRFINNSFDWFTTIRAKAGLTICDALIYVTGGAAVARFDTKWVLQNQADPEGDNIRFQFCDTCWGWTGGVGTEFAMWCNWTLGAEVLYMHFSENRRKASVINQNQNLLSFVFGHSNSAWVGRILLNYRFGDLCSCCCGW